MPIVALKKPSSDFVVRREIDAMKKAAMAPVPSSLKEMTPAPASALIAGLGLTANAKPSTSSSSQINTYNPRKDVSGSTSAALSAMSPKFWGASTPASGNYTSCHTTFVPDLVLPGASPLTSPSLSTTSSYSAASTSASPYGFARANLNPLLNDKKSSTEPSSPTGTSVVSLATSCDGSDLSDTFGNWSADNGFTWNNLDAYRMQLWSRMARDASFARQGVPTDMRPKFLRESTSGGPVTHPYHKPSMTVNEALSPVGDYAAPPPTYRESHDDPTPTITQIIQHTISSRLFSSFLTALKTTTALNATSRFDNDKIMDIVQGKATLGVVPVDPPAYTEKNSPVKDKFDVDAEHALAMSLNNLKLATENMARSKIPEEVGGRRAGVSVGSRG